MLDYNRIRYYCDKSSAISKRLIDDFLLPLCAAEEGTEKKFVGMLDAYQSITQKMPKNWPLWLLSQYIAFDLFHEDGLASKYLNHFQMRRRSAKELDFLKFQIDHPWRFVFCSIEQNPKDCFFEMKDVLAGEEFLLYSPGIAQMEKQIGPISGYFLLISFNGDCWQTYGLNNYFKGIQPFDLLYFAKQLKPDLDFIHEIPALIDANPLPFMMLCVGAEFPLTYHKKDLLIIAKSDFRQEEFELEKFIQDFIIEQKSSVYMLSLKYWQGHPHFCKCFYDMDKKIFSLNAMTDRGYSKLVKVLNNLGYDFPEQPEIRVTMPMFLTAKEVLGGDDEINPYDKLFREEPSPEEKAKLDRINNFLNRLMDAINSGTEYDLGELALLAGIELEIAQELEEKVKLRQSQG